MYFLQLNSHCFFAVISCTQPPDAVIPPRETFEISCATDSEVAVCLWTHRDPDNGDGAPALVCSGGSSEHASSCSADSRVELKVTHDECGITVTNSSPADSGKWKLEVLDSGMNSITAEIELKTFNLSTTLGIFASSREQFPVVDELEVEMDTMVELEARAEGGRPHPEFKWIIEGDEVTDDRYFTTLEYEKGCSDDGNLLCTKASNLAFKLDQALLNSISKNDSFSVVCATNQRMTNNNNNNDDDKGGQWKDEKKVELKIIYGQHSQS